MVGDTKIKLGDLIEKNICKKSIKDNELITLIPMEDVSEEGKIINENIIPFGEVKSGLTYFEKNDVLVAKITPCFENGKGACLDELNTIVGFGSTEFHVLRAKKNAIPRYIFYHTQLESFRKKLEREMVGSAGQKRVPLSLINRYSLPIAHSIDEQRAIALVLKDIDELITSTENLINKKQKIKLGTIQRFFINSEPLPGFNGERKIKVMGNIGSAYGGLSGKVKSDFEKGNKPYISFLNVMNNTVIDTTELEYVNIDKNEKQNCALQGDLFFNTSSETPEEVGMCSVLLNNIDELYLNSFCFGFRLNKDSGCDPLYLAYYFRSELGRRQLYSLAQGSTRYNLSKNSFYKLKINCPDIEEQEAIVKILRDMDSEINVLKQKLVKCKMLKQGIMQELLIGRTRLV